MGEAFAGSGEVFVDRFEMIFQRLVKFLVHAATQFGFPSQATRRVDPGLFALAQSDSCYTVLALSGSIPSAEMGPALT